MTDASHNDDGPALVRGFAGQDILRLALLSYAAIIAAALAMGFLFTAGAPTTQTSAPAASDLAAPPAPAPQPLALARQSIEREFAQQPDYAVFFTRLKSSLPGEYNAIVDGFAKQALDGKNLHDVDALLSQAVRELRVSKGLSGAKADGPALAHIFDVQLQMMQALAATNPKLCVDFLYGGASPGFFSFSASHRPLVARMATAGLDAIVSGRANGIDRDPPSDADFNQLSSAMKSLGVTDAEISAILDGKMPNPPIPDARMCAVGQIYLKTLASLPEQARLRIYALAVSLMARS